MVIIWKVFDKNSCLQCCLQKYVTVCCCCVWLWRCYLV